MTDDCWENFKKKFKSEDEAASNGAGAEAGASGGEGGIGKGMKGLGGLTKNLPRFAGFGLGDDEQMEITEITEIPEDWDVTTDALADDECFKITLNIIRAEEVAAMDSNGFSDPYVEVVFSKDVSVKTKTISKTINPVWNETFTLFVDDRCALANINVYDHDIFGSNDRIGYLDLDLQCIPPYQRLTRTQELGSSVEGEEFVGRLEYSYLVEIVKVERARDIKSIGSKGVEKLLGIIQVTVIEGIDLPPMNSDGTCDPYIRFNFGTQKYETKVCQSTLDPKWREDFEFKYLSSSGNIIQASIWDSESGLSDNIIGETEIDIAKIPPNKPFKFVLKLEQTSAKINVLLKILKFAELGATEMQLQKEINDSEKNALEDQFSLAKTLSDIDAIGYIVVKLIRASNIPDKGLGTVDPYCIMELENCRCVTPIRESNLEPEWNLTYRFPVNDYHSILYISLYDEEDLIDDELLGKIAIPLFNCPEGIKRYILKDAKLEGLGKGELVIEAHCFYNPIRAAIRTFAPKEEIIMKDPPKFEVSLLQRDVKRITAQVEMVQDGAEGLDQIIRWRSKPKSAISLVIFVTVVYFFELWMAPLALGIVLALNFLAQRFGFKSKEHWIHSSWKKPYYELEKADEDGVNTGFGAKVKAVFKIAELAQYSLDLVASLGEKLSHIGQWKNTFISFLVTIILFVAGIALYFVSVRYILIAWGLNKFRKFYMTPNLVDNNEIFDLLTRIPSFPEIERYRQVKRNGASLIEEETGGRRQQEIDTSM